MDFNKVILMGRLTREPELGQLQNGTAVCDLGLALNNRKQVAGQWVNEPVFVDVAVYGQKAQNAHERLYKGRPVLVEGRLKYDTWEKDGQKRSKLRVTGEKLIPLPTINRGEEPVEVGGEEERAPEQVEAEPEKEQAPQKKRRARKSKSQLDHSKADE